MKRCPVPVRLCLVLLVSAVCVRAQTVTPQQPPSTLHPEAASPAPPPKAAEPASKRLAFEGVVYERGRPIGTTILLNVSAAKAVSGWIQRNNFFPIDSGADAGDHIKFTSGGNSYDINLNTMRITFSGPDGNGNEPVTRMTRVEGEVYKLTEPIEEDADLVLRTDLGDRHYVFEEPAIWKRVGPPLDRIEYERILPILGKTTGVWLSKSNSRYIAVVEEPQGLDLVKKLPKEKKNKKDKKK